MRGSPVTVGGRQYEVIPDLTGRDQVFIIGSVIDDADGRPIARDVTLTSNEPLVFSAQSAREIALAGNPRIAFVDRSVAQTVDVSLRADVYRPASVSITIPAFAALPHRQDFELRRLPVTMSGRAFGRTAGPTPAFDPLSGASIQLSPIPASGGERPLLLRQTLRAGPVAGTTIRQRGITPEASLTAASDANSGDALIAVDDGSAVAVGQLLRVGPAHRRFYSEVAQVIPHPDLPAPASLIQLTESMVGTIRSGTTVERFTVGAFSGPTGTLAGAAFAGEGVVWLDNIPSSGGVLVIQEAGQPDRYHDANALTSPTGDYLIEGVARVGEPTFEVSAAGFTTLTSTIRLDRLDAGPNDWYLVP